MLFCLILCFPLLSKHFVKATQKCSTFIIILHIFDGNSGRDDIVKHNIEGLTIARVIGFQPTADSGHKALRVEVYGIEKPRAIPSQPPSTFTVNPQSSTSVRASWGLPPLDSIHEPVIGFKVLFKQNISGSSKEQIIIGGNTTLLKDVTGLLIFTEYEFQVLAFTSAGDGKKSPVLTVTTNEAAPSQPPTNFTVSVGSSTSLLTSWELPPEDSRNGIITGFTLYYRITGSGDSETLEVVNGGYSRNKILRGLLKFTQYDVRVSASTSAGTGTRSTVVNKTTAQDAPSIPTSLGSTIINPSESSGPTVEFTWSKPLQENGIIQRYTVFYNPTGDPQSVRSKNIKASTFTHTAEVQGGVEYQFRVRAETILPGPSASLTVNIPEYAPSAPRSLDHSIIPPSESHGPMVNLTWSKPEFENGNIKRYEVFYSHNEDPHVYSDSTNDLTNAFEVLGGVTYQLDVRAVTIAPGTNASGTVTIEEYAPSVGPENISFAKANETTWNISWVPIPREKSYGRIKVYEVKQEFISRGEHQRRSTSQSNEINSTQTHTVVSDLQLCAQYNIYVRGFTGAGPGPYSTPVALVTSMPGAPQGLKATSTKDDHVTLVWEESIVDVEGGLTYTVEYSGTKDYNTSFTDNGQRNANKSTTYVVTGLVPGSRYKFDIYGASACGIKGQIITLPDITTHNADPIAPAVHNLTEAKVDETSAEIVLWPAEQRNGPISAYQVIVLEVSDGDETLPSDYHSKIEDYKKASESNLNFYITAELENEPVRTVPWVFTVGDGKEEKNFVNAELKRGQTYVVYLRAITRDNKAPAILAGKASKVAKITVNQGAGKGEANTDKAKKDNILFGAVIALSCFSLILLVVIAIVIMCCMKRRRQSLPNNVPNTKDGNSTTVQGRNPQEPEPPSYMELHPRPGCEQPSTGQPVYQSLHQDNSDAEYCNAGFHNQGEAGHPQQSEAPSYLELRPRHGSQQPSTVPGSESPGYYNVGLNTKNKKEEQDYEEIGNIRS